MEKAIYNLISALADNYGFDADQAFEYAQWETDTNHLAEILKMVSVEMPKQTIKENKGGAAGGATTKPAENPEADDKIAACKKNIANWEKKLANGKVTDVDAHQKKIDKEKEKLAKLEEKAEKKGETEKKVKTEKTEKRIKRFSPVMATQLKKLVEDAGLEMNDNIKKDFQQYVEDLSDAKYRESGLADHMRDFVKTKKGGKKTEEAEKKVEQAEKVEMMEAAVGSSNAVGGGGPEVQVLSLEELQAVGTIASIDPPGTYWDADGGRFVRGPAAEDDEDFIEIKFEKKAYVVGEKTGRVYEAHDTGDVFAGFIGVGKFKSMKMP